MTQYFEINTLHRRKYMISFFSLLIIAGFISSQISGSEIVKIIAILFTIPIILYLSVKWSNDKSTWEIDEQKLIIRFSNKTKTYHFRDIDHIRSLTRSGGNLYVIYLKNKSPKRFWRNKLFVSEDDHEKLHQHLLQQDIEYFKM